MMIKTISFSNKIYFVSGITLNDLKPKETFLSNLFNDWKNSNTSFYWIDWFTDIYTYYYTDTYI